jgi:hypothetical protein
MRLATLRTTFESSTTRHVLILAFVYSMTEQAAASGEDHAVALLETPFKDYSPIQPITGPFHIQVNFGARATTGRIPGRLPHAIRLAAIVTKPGEVAPTCLSEKEYRRLLQPSRCD